MTSGSELDNHIKDTDNGLETGPTWACYLAKKLCPDAEYFCAALGGASNETVVRRGIYHISEKLKKYHSEEILVLVMWTSLGRKTWRIKDTNRQHDNLYIDTTANIGLDLIARKNLENPKMQEIKHQGLNEVVKATYRKMHHDQNLYDSHQAVEYLDFFLDAHGIQNFQTSAWNDFVISEKMFEDTLHIVKDKYLHRMLERAAKKNIFSVGNCNGFFLWAKANKYDTHPGGHPVEAAHEKYARLMYRWIVKNE